MVKKILVTGAAGFIGHHFVEYVLDKTDWNIICLDRLDPAGDLNRLPSIKGWDLHKRRVSIVHHDLRAEINDEVSRSLITGRGAFSSHPFDYAIHMAAGSHVDRSVIDPVGFILDNVVGTAHFLNFFRRSPSPLANDGKILYFSSDEVFGPASDSDSFSEWARFNPNNPYSATKAGGEALCSAYANTYGLPILVTHSTNVFGDRQHPEKFIPLVIRKVIMGDTIQIHSDKTKTKSTSRFYVHVHNISSAVLFLLKHGLCLDGSGNVGKYNLTGDKDISNIEIVEIIARILGREFRYEMVDFVPNRPRHDMRYAVDGSLILSMGWKPEISFEDGIKKTIEGFLSR